MPKKPTTDGQLVRNIQFLLAEFGDERGPMSQSELARRAKVAQRTVNKTMNGESKPSVETAEALASAFGLHGWHLLLRDLPARFPHLKQMSLLETRYMEASPEGRDLIDRVAERESTYSPRHKDAKNGQNHGNGR